MNATMTREYGLPVRYEACPGWKVRILRRACVFSGQKAGARPVALAPRPAQRGLMRERD